MIFKQIMKNTPFVMFAMTVFFTSCESKLDEYYKLPDWLKGNSWEVLESRGNYTSFLKAVERVGYTDMMQGKGIITVMAPDDTAFNK